MPKVKIHNSQLPHFVTFTVVDWIDVFLRERYRDIILKSIEYSRDQKGLQIFGWVLMPNHIHLIIRAREDHDLRAIIRDMKKFTAREILTDLETNNRESRRKWMLWMFRRAGSRRSGNNIYQFWQHRSYPVEISSDKFFYQKLNYMHNNPVKAGLCYKPEDYPFSSARWYNNGEGKLMMDNVYQFDN